MIVVVHKFTSVCLFFRPGLKFFYGVYTQSLTDLSRALRGDFFSKIGKAGSCQMAFQKASPTYKLQWVNIRK